MQRTDIDWANYSWNVISGCRNSCRYCYAARMAKRLKGRFGYPADDPFRPTFHLDRLHEPCNLKSKRGERIFTVSMGDMFSEGVSWPWVDAVMKVIVETPQHNFIILTKRPDRITELLQESRKWVLNAYRAWNPDNIWLGVTVNTWDDIWRVEALAKSVPWFFHKFISFEPLHLMFEMDSDWRTHRLCGLIAEHNIEWLIMGAETGPDACRYAPVKTHITKLENIAKATGTPLFMKENIRQYVPQGIEFRQEYPDGLK